MVQMFLIGLFLFLSPTILFIMENGVEEKDPETWFLKLPFNTMFTLSSMVVGGVALMFGAFFF